MITDMWTWDLGYVVILRGIKLWNDRKSLKYYKMRGVQLVLEGYATIAWGVRNKGIKGTQLHIEGV